MACEQRNIRISGGVVVKTHDPELMRIEVAKTQQAYKIAESNRLFRVPKVLDYDEFRGIATFEKLHNFQPLLHIVLASKQDSSEMLARVGKILAVIHRELLLPENMVFPLPPDLRLYGASEVFLHGDFNATNIGVNSNSEIAVFDWQMTAVHGEKSTYGTRYFDVVWLINHLFYIPFHFNFLTYIPEKPLFAFLRNYFMEANRQSMLSEFCDYMKHFFMYKFALRRKQMSLLDWIKLLPFHGRFFAFTRYCHMLKFLDHHS